MTFRLSLCLVVLTLWVQAALADNAVIPTPVHVKVESGEFTLQSGDAISSPEGFLESAAWIARLVGEYTGIELGTIGSPDAAIVLRQVGSRPLEQRFVQAGLARPGRMEDSYFLSVKPGRVELLASAPEGMFYGLVTLWQLLVDGHGTVAAQTVIDSPEFAWRGLMLDSARHMQSVEFIKDYIDWMALHKMSVFHWHLTDDQSWRLEIKAYPKLAEVGGYRVPAGDAPAADIDPATGKPRLYGGYYTQDEVREIVAHAARRFITVVPEIDVPGHATAAIAAYPELGVSGHGVESPSPNWGIFHNVFNLEENTFKLLEGVLSEVVGLFPGPFIHLGGDEVETGQWEKSARTAERMKELGIEDIQSLQNYYVERLQAYLDPFGKRVIGWDEILQSELPPHAVVMSWRGSQGAIEAAAKGHQTIMSPAPTLYLDHIQTTDPDAPPGRGGVITTRDIFELDLLPETLQENRDLLLGVQGNLWTEHVRTEERAAYMTWPRAAAIAELGWSQPASRNWEDFAARLPRAVSRMKQLGIPAATDAHALYRKPLPGPQDGYPARREDRELTLCSQAIVLALEDDAPLDGVRESFLLDIQNPCWIWKDVEISRVDTVSAAVGQLPFNFEIGESIKDVKVELPVSQHGELRVRMGHCDGPVVADLSLEPAAGNHAVTELGSQSLSLPEDAPERADLCFSFTRKDVAPIWAIDWVQLEKRG